MIWDLFLVVGYYCKFIRRLLILKKMSKKDKFGGGVGSRGEKVTELLVRGNVLLIFFF